MEFVVTYSVCVYDLLWLYWLCYTWLPTPLPSPAHTPLTLLFCTIPHNATRALGQCFKHPELYQLINIIWFDLILGLRGRFTLCSPGCLQACALPHRLRREMAVSHWRDFWLLRSRFWTSVATWVNGSPGYCPSFMNFSSFSLLSLPWYILLWPRQFVLGRF